MDSFKIYKEQLLNNYISGIDDLSNVNYNQMKLELKNILGEEPAIKINYIKEKGINENNGETIEYEKMESITILFTIETNGRLNVVSKEYLL
jgi:hypothetical protein